MTQTKCAVNAEEVHPLSLHAAGLLDEVLNDASKHRQLKAEYIAVSCGLKPQTLTNYRTGSRPLPLGAAAAIDNFLGGNRLLLGMAAMEGITGLICGEAS
jgi:hypothetical protein